MEITSVIQSDTTGAYDVYQTTDGAFLQMRKVNGEGAVNKIAASGTAVTVDLSKGNFVDLTLTGTPCVVTFANMPAGQTEMLWWIRQDATGTRLITWPASVKNAPTLTVTASRYDIVELASVDSGVTWVASVFAANQT